MLIYLYYLWFMRYRKADWIIIKNKCRQKNIDWESKIGKYFITGLVFFDVPILILLAVLLG